MNKKFIEKILSILAKIDVMYDEKTNNETFWVYKDENKLFLYSNNKLKMVSTFTLMELAIHLYGYELNEKDFTNYENKIIKSLLDLVEINV